MQDLEETIEDDIANFLIEDEVERSKARNMKSKGLSYN